MGTPVTRIESIFADLRAEGRTALMPYVTAGDPSLETTEAVLPALEAAGASIVEIGFPFSDPIADGPVIAAAMHDALDRGVTPPAVLEMVRRLRPQTALGLVAMVSQSIIDRMGPEAFVQDAADAGIDGLIVPDIDTATATALRERIDAHRMTFSLLVAPTTPDARMAELTALSTGFVYVLARAGITGERTELPDVARVVERVRRHTDLPLAVGFGISTAEQVATVTGCADAAIVGSALVRRMRDATDPITAARTFTAELASGLRSQVL